MRFAHLMLSCIAMLGAQALAQSNSAPVMKENEVSQSALIEALAPPAPAPAAEGAVRTRSLRAVREDPLPARRPPKAQLLVTFDTNSARLTPSARKALDVVARALDSDRLAGHSFVIEGHADPRGPEDKNLRLSRERAQSVREYLNSKGIDPDRLRPVGKGAADPINPADPTAPENRRVTFVTVLQ